ncbi:MAG TPA: alkaline phosphatase family protein [Actinocrinis sp.]|nr:alkaline phosphatase family protein [Actinocrinis sp.]
MRRRSLIPLLGAVIALGATGAPPAAAAQGSGTTTPIKHFIYLMQGGRTFDNYFGTYPGADGLADGKCQRLDVSARDSPCVKPFPLHDKAVPVLAAGRQLIATQIDGGKMDAFVSAYEQQNRDGTSAVGYYDRTDLATSWAAADQYVLFDGFFSDAAFGAITNRSYWISGAGAPAAGQRIPAAGFGNQPTIFDRLQAAGVSWKFYVQDYNPAHTFRTVVAGRTDDQATRVPVLDYARFVDDPALRSHIVDLSEYYRDLERGTLPAVAYVATSGADERSARSIPTAQRLLQTMINQLMVSRYWPSTAFLWSYEQSGGWYDHVTPPTTPSGTLGIRVPAQLVSAYAPVGRIDHTMLDPTSALRFIETNWRLQPLAARDAAAANLSTAFDFSAGPRKAVLLPGALSPSANQVKAAAAPPHTGSARIAYLIAGLLAALTLLAAAVSGVRRNRADALDPDPDPQPGAAPEPELAPVSGAGSGQPETETVETAAEP